jgi:hypothetical protein
MGLSCLLLNESPSYDTPISMKLYVYTVRSPSHIGTLLWYLCQSAVYISAAVVNFAVSRVFVAVGFRCLWLSPHTVLQLGIKGVIGNVTLIAAHAQHLPTCLSELPSRICISFNLDAKSQEHCYNSPVVYSDVMCWITRSSMNLLQFGTTHNRLR